MPLMASLINDTVEEKILELQDMLVETLKTEKQGENDMGKKTAQHRISKNFGTTRTVW